MFESRFSAGATEKLPGWKAFSSWQTIRQKVQSFKPLHGWSWLQERGVWISGELSDVCSQIVLKCFFLARIGRPDILWTVNKLARSVTKWTRACDRRLARLISYIHHTSDYRQYCHVGNTAQHCRLGLFPDSKSTSGRILCVFGSRTFVPISWMCKKQTSVSHSSTESEIISLDAGLRMDGLPALDLWDVVMEALRSSKSTQSPTHQAAGNFSRNDKSKPKQQGKPRCWINCRTWTTSPQTQILVKASLSCTSLKTNRQWSEWSLRAEVQWGDTCQEPT